MQASDVTAVVIHTDMARTGWFECSDERLNQLHATSCGRGGATASGCPTDCPQRDERLGWTGDINAFAPTAAFLYDVRSFLGSWLEDLAAEQAATGRVPFIVPDVLHGFDGPTALWGDVAVSLPWTLYQALRRPRHPAPSVPLDAGLRRFGRAPSRRRWALVERVPVRRLGRPRLAAREPGEGQGGSRAWSRPPTCAAPPASSARQPDCSAMRTTPTGTSRSEIGCGPDSAMSG